jgi:VWFA-related protein
VLNKSGQPVDDLTPQEFRLFEDGQEQAITSAALENRPHLSIGFLMQWSGMRQSTLVFGEIEPAIEFFKSVMGKDDFSFAAKFTANVDTLVDFTNDTSLIEHALLDAMSARPWGGVALYDSLIWACNQKLSTRPQRRILLVVADGRDNESKKSLDDAIESALMTQTTIYLASLAYAIPNLTALRTGGAIAMRTGLRDCAGVARELAARTGGDAIFVRKQEDLTLAFGKIEQQIRNQYNVIYSPGGKARNRAFRKIKVEVRRGGLRVLAPKGYYSPTP